MSPFTQMKYLCKFLIGGYNNVLCGKNNWLIPVQLQTYQYTKKSAEEKLGINKPKKPLNPFFKFMTQMRPALLTKIPGISTKDAIVWSSKHWQQIDRETKSQMKKEYKEDLENYKKIRAKYLASLTESQKEDIKKMNQEMIASRARRKLKAEYKEMGKPKKPMSSYLLFTQSRNYKFLSNNLKEYQESIRADWLKLPPSERTKFETQAEELMKKYKKDVKAWELKMISIGCSHLVPQKEQKKGKNKNVKATKKIS